MKPITSAITFMTDNITDPVARMGVRPNGKVFYRTVGGILYELDEAQIAILDRYGYRPRLTPALAGPARQPFLKDTFADEWDRFCDADPTADPELSDNSKGSVE